MIPVYVINLQRSVERRAWMEKELAGAAVEAEFIAAVDGRRFGPACKSSSARRNPVRAISAPEAAVTLSHRKAWRMFLRSGAPFAVVLEDDVHLGRGLAQVLESDWTRWRFDIVKLETKLERAGSRERETRCAEIRGDPFADCIRATSAPRPIC